MSLIREKILRRRRLGKPDEPLIWAVAVSTCPLCKNALSGGVCLECIDHSRRRMERAALQANARQQQGGLRPGRVAPILAVVACAAIGLTIVGEHERALASVRQTPAEQSVAEWAAANQLVVIADGLDKAAEDAQRHLVQEADRNPTEIDSLLAHVGEVESQLNVINPRVDGNGGATWKSMSEMCGQLKATITSFRTLTPDLDGQGIQSVRGRLKSTRKTLQAALESNS